MHGFAKSRREEIGILWASNRRTSERESWEKDKTNDQNECVRRVGALRREVVELNERAVVFD